MKPYFYKIKEKGTDRFYVGCQYGKNSNPLNFWVTYFTSNKYIKSQPKNTFELVYIKERIDAREYEKKYLQKCYNLLGKEKFLQLLINRNIAPGILNTPESLARANSKEKKLKNSLAAKKRIKEGTHNFQTNPYVPTADHKAALSERMKNNNYGSLIIRDEKYQKKQAEKSKGNINVRGKKWWFNPITLERKRCFEQPGDAWINSNPSCITKEGVEKIKIANKKSKSIEHKHKLSCSAKQRVKEGTHNFLKENKS